MVRRKKFYYVEFSIKRPKTKRIIKIKGHTYAHTKLGAKQKIGRNYKVYKYKKVYLG